MADYIDTLKQALKDPELKGVRYFLPQEKDAILEGLEDHPNTKYISEWKYEVGKIKHKFKLHEDNIGKQLEELFKQKKTSRHPELVWVYSVDDVNSLLAGAN